MADSRVNFDGRALHAALDDQRTKRALTWTGVAREMNNQSHEINARKPDHPLAASTISTLAHTGRCSCQHALMYLRWLAQAPEEFLTGPVTDVGDTTLPACDADHRLRWAVKLTWASLDERRREANLTWTDLAASIGCRPAQLTGLRTARYGMDMELALRCAQWLGRPAADFTYAADW